MRLQRPAQARPGPVQVPAASVLLARSQNEEAATRRDLRVSDRGELQLLVTLLASVT